MLGLGFRKTNQAQAYTKERARDASVGFRFQAEPVLTGDLVLFFRGIFIKRCLLVCSVSIGERIRK